MGNLFAHLIKFSIKLIWLWVRFILILQTIKNAHILGFTDEVGYMNLIDTRMKLKSSATHQENAGF